MSTTEESTNIPPVLKSEPSSTSTSRSVSPTIAISPPTPGEELELDLPSAIRGISIERSTPDARKHTDMGWPGHDFTYFSLSEEKAASELERLAAPKVLCNGTVHAVNFQPHPEKHSQDRYVATEWDLKDSGIWKFRAVFDGHAAGDETVDFTFATLPSNIEASLAAIPATQLSDVDLFPSPEFLEKLSDDEIRNIVNDQSTSAVENADVMVPSPIGPITMAKKYSGRGPNNIKFSLKNKVNQIARLKKEHPGEEDDVVAKNRVLSLIACYKRYVFLKTSLTCSSPRSLYIAIGDNQFKLPSIYTLRVFALTVPGMNRPEHHSQMITERNRTPPYVSGVPEVGYVKLEKGVKGTCIVFDPAQRYLDALLLAFLIMCSDGLMDLYGGEDWQEKKVDMMEMFKSWVGLVGEKLDSPSATNTDKHDPLNNNLALLLLRRGLRGPTIATSRGQSPWTDVEALDRMSSLLTLECRDKWMDDTTVMVETL
ncbi:hypothetical protein BT96DRAFT_1003730 [Gymnopus androsaceus JB14]|uniref:Protein serine/threonine phosphatase 2C n=1 Tax=Gymnopus androsaceus JB14 TaxID=1447944 RepID=A0A6A4GT40_9AGAR|nr:hypothetical protein BT96DRAFT_1003730 [Gymnopus androsaceus JB14]